MNPVEWLIYAAACELLSRVYRGLPARWEDSFDAYHDGLNAAYLVKIEGMRRS